MVFKKCTMSLQKQIRVLQQGDLEEVVHREINVTWNTAARIDFGKRLRKVVRLLHRHTHTYAHTHTLVWLRSEELMIRGRPQRCVISVWRSVTLWPCRPTETSHTHTRRNRVSEQVRENFLMSNTSSIGQPINPDNWTVHHLVLLGFRKTGSTAGHTSCPTSANGNRRHQVFSSI